MDRATELYMLAADLQNAYIRLHPELQIVMQPLAGVGRPGGFVDDGVGHFMLYDKGREHTIVRLDLSPWITAGKPDVSRES